MAQELALGVIAGREQTHWRRSNMKRSLGVPTAHISYPAAMDSEAGVRAIEAARRATGIEITTVFCSSRQKALPAFPQCKPA